MAGFVDFVAEASQKPELGKECIGILKNASPEEFEKWFKDKGFEVTLEDCKKLVENKDNLVNIRDVSAKGDY